MVGYARKHLRKTDLVARLGGDEFAMLLPETSQESARVAIAKLQKRYFFYVWDEEASVVRWMCSFDTTKEDVARFAEFLAKAVIAKTVQE